ncbi:hypothetical protein [uncultured Sphingomonas sp.]|uniref:hypothetical protein n=1 Tax=uncultured Sphingomonas sp. TaxID=158754 RepID=UPI0035CC92BB
MASAARPRNPRGNDKGVPPRHCGGTPCRSAETDQAVTVPGFANRRRMTSAAAAAPNSRTIGGAGTGAGLPPLEPELPPDEEEDELLLEELLEELLDDELPFELHPLLLEL